MKLAAKILFILGITGCVTQPAIALPDISANKATITTLTVLGTTNLLGTINAPNLKVNLTNVGNLTISGNLSVAGTISGANASLTNLTVTNTADVNHLIANSISAPLNASDLFGKVPNALVDLSTVAPSIYADNALIGGAWTFTQPTVLQSTLDTTGAGIFRSSVAVYGTVSINTPAVTTLTNAKLNINAGGNYAMYMTYRTGVSGVRFLPWSDNTLRITGEGGALFPVIFGEDHGSAPMILSVHALGSNGWNPGISVRGTGAGAQIGIDNGDSTGNWGSWNVYTNNAGTYFRNCAAAGTGYASCFPGTQYMFVSGVDQRVTFSRAVNVSSDVVVTGGVTFSDGSRQTTAFVSPASYALLAGTQTFSGLNNFSQRINVSSDVVVAGVTFADGTRQTTAGGGGSGGGNAYTNVGVVGQIPYYVAADSIAASGIQPSQLLTSTSPIPGNLINLSTYPFVLTSGSYSNPSWLTYVAPDKLDYSTITLAIANATASVPAALYASTGTWSAEQNFSSATITNLCLSGDCKSAWPTSGGGGGNVYSPGGTLGYLAMFSVGATTVAASTYTFENENGLNVSSNVLTVGDITSYGHMYANDMTATYGLFASSGNITNGLRVGTLGINVAAPSNYLLQVGANTSMPSGYIAYFYNFYANQSALAVDGSASDGIGLTATGKTGVSAGTYDGGQSLYLRQDANSSHIKFIQANITGYGSDQPLYNTSQLTASAVSSDVYHAELTNFTGKWINFIKSGSPTFYVDNTGYMWSAASATFAAGIDPASISLSTVTSALATKGNAYTDIGTPGEIAYYIAADSITAAGIQPSQLLTSTSPIPGNLIDLSTYPFVLTSGSYSDPAWITYISPSKLDYSTITLAIENATTSVPTAMYASTGSWSAEQVFSSATIANLCLSGRCSSSWVGGNAYTDVGTIGQIPYYISADSIAASGIQPSQVLTATSPIVTGQFVSKMDPGTAQIVLRSLYSGNYYSTFEIYGGIASGNGWARLQTINTNGMSFEVGASTAAKIETGGGITVNNTTTFLSSATLLNLGLVNAANSSGPSFSALNSTSTLFSLANGYYFPGLSGGLARAAISGSAAGLSAGPASRTGVGVFGAADGDTGGGGVGVIGISTNSVKSYGVIGYGHGTSANIGVAGGANDSGAYENIGIYGYAANGSTNYAGYFNGNVNVTGTLTIPSGAVVESYTVYKTSTCAPTPVPTSCTVTCDAGYYINGAPGYFCSGGVAPYGLGFSGLSSGVGYYTAACVQLTLYAQCRRIK